MTKSIGTRISELFAHFSALDRTKTEEMIRLHHEAVADASISALQGEASAKMDASKYGRYDSNMAPVIAYLMEHGPSSIDQIIDGVIDGGWMSGRERRVNVSRLKHSIGRHIAFGDLIEDGSIRLRCPDPPIDRNGNLVTPLSRRRQHYENWDALQAAPKCAAEGCQNPPAEGVKYCDDHHALLVEERKAVNYRRGRPPKDQPA